MTLWKLTMCLMDSGEPDNVLQSPGSNSTRSLNLGPNPQPECSNCLVHCNENGTYN